MDNKSEVLDGYRSPFWLDRPTFVTGGTGLAGSWLVRQLIGAGADLVCLVRDWIPQAELVRAGVIEQVKIVRGDVCDQNLLERILSEYEIDTVIHLAAQTTVSIAQHNPTLTFRTNIQGTWSLLEACRCNPTVKQIVIASSDKVYGDQNGVPYNEDMPLQSGYPYEVSKSCADFIAQSYAKTYRLPLIIARCGNFYGGGDLNWNRIVPGTIRSIIRSQCPIIYSGGNQVRDYFYVEDAVAAYMLLAEQLSIRPELIGEAFNFSNESHMNALELVQRILTLMDSNLKPDIRIETRKEILNQRLRTTKAREKLKWEPRFTLDRGLQKTIAWYRDFFA